MVQSEEETELDQLFSWHGSDNWLSMYKQRVAKREVIGLRARSSHMISYQKKLILAGFSGQICPENRGLLVVDISRLAEWK